MKLARPRSLVTLANDVVPIITVCRLVGMDLPADLTYGRSRKLHCPFGETAHSDHGLDPAFRVYPESNSAYCFACAAYYTPVALYAHAVDTDRRTAAADLLDRVGHRPLSLTEAWAKLTTAVDPPDVASLRAALQTYCRRVCADWDTRQFDPDVAVVLAMCLDLLDRVDSVTDVQDWLQGVKAVMARVLHRVETRRSG